MTDGFFVWESLMDTSLSWPILTATRVLPRVGADSLPGNSPLILRNLGTSEIYALALESH